MLNLEEYKTIIRMEREYQGIINNTEYLNNLILEENKTINLGMNIGYFIKNEMLDRIENILLIYSVSVAYHYYDEIGYWPHFFEICGLKGTTKYDSQVGYTIESTLADKGYLEYKREGPFRYVGAILEQTGITKRSIPKYVDIIKILYIKYKHEENLFKLKDYFDEYLEIIDCPKYLKGYLKDKAGWEFTLHVLKIVDYVLKGTLKTGDIYDIRGFYPGFWEEFFYLYRLEHENIGKIYKPKFHKEKTRKPSIDLNKEISLEWKHKPDYISKDGNYSIFYSNMPEIKIKNKYLLDNNIYFLFLDIGFGPKRIRDGDQFIKFLEDEPCVIGEIWAEPFDRKSKNFNQTKVEPIRFCYISKDHVVLPTSMYKSGETITVKILTKKVQLLDCETSQENSDVFIIPENFNEVKVKVKSNKFNIVFVLPINRTTSDILPKQKIYHQWREEVLDEKLGYFNSHIALLPEGKNLIRAWKLYRRNNKNSIKILNNIHGKDPMVKELKQILNCLLYLKKFRIKAISKELEHYSKGDFKEIIYTYKNYYSIIYDEPVKQGVTITDNILKSIPFLEEDKVLLKNINNIINGEKIEYNSWIELLLLYKMSINNGEEVDFYKSELKKTYKYIPSSPETGELLKDIYK